MDIDRGRLLLFLRTCHNDDGGFGSKPGSETDMESTRFGFQSFLMKEGGQRVRRWVRKCRNREGSAFSSRPSAEPDLASTYYALILLRETDSFGLARGSSISGSSIISGGGKASGRCLNWIRQRQRPEGGFAPKLEEQPDIDNTFYALNALKELQGRVARGRLRECIRFVLDCHAESGAFSNSPGSTLRMESTYCGVRCLDLLVKPARMRQTSTGTDTKLGLSVKGLSPTNTIDWILSCQSNVGAFGTVPDARPRVSDTYWAIHALRILQEEGDTPFTSFPYREECAHWLKGCQGQDGGFKSSPESSEDSNAWCTYCAIQALFLLNFI